MTFQIGDRVILKNADITTQGTVQSVVGTQVKVRWETGETGTYSADALIKIKPTR